MWRLLQILPFAFLEKISNYEDVAWTTFLNLRNLVELITAPKLSINQTALIDSKVREYLTQRQKLFPRHPWRPKHHYLNHYGDLFRQFGPLIRFSTLRWESKHGYFKNIIRHSPNFKNVTYSLSLRHQLLQSLYSAGILFHEKAIPKEVTPLYSNLYSDAINCLINTNCPQNLLVCETSVNFRGIDYRKGMFVPVTVNADTVELCEIQLMLLTTSYEQLFFIGDQYFTNHLYEFGLHKIISDNSRRKVVICEATNLTDFHPFVPINYKNERLIWLRHALLDPL